MSRADRGEGRSCSGKEAGQSLAGRMVGYSAVAHQDEDGPVTNRNGQLGSPLKKK